MKKIYSTIILILVMLFAMPIVTNAAAKNPTISVEKIRNPKDDIVKVGISIADNQGVCGAGLQVDYDEGLVLKSIEAGDAFTKLTMTKPGNLSANPINIVWDGVEEDNSNGVIAYLVFERPQSDKVYDIKLSVNEGGIRDVNMKAVTPVLMDGYIQVGQDGGYFSDNKDIIYSGYKLLPNVIVSLDNKMLVEGKDYKITYTNNQNASTVTKPAKYTITYKGDYKKRKKETYEFTILQAKMENTTVSCNDVITYTKPGVFKSKPVVDLNGYVLKASDYTVSYWLDKECTIPMDSKHKLAIDDDMDFEYAYVKVTGKNKNTTGSQVTAYKVYRKPQKGDERVNITKCKLQWKDTSVKKGITYKEKTAQEPEVEVYNSKVKVEEGYTVTYMGNIQKGTATVIVTGDGIKAVGSKTINFKIK